MRSAIIISVICFLCSCGWRKYPAERYAIPKLYRDLIASYKAGDTLKFKDSKRNLALYLILRIDSSLHNERGFFMNAREYKDISIACHEITNSRRGYDDYNLILITKYPDEDSIYFNLRLKDFYGINPGEPFRHNKDTVIVNDFSFSNYYSFRPYNYAEQEDSNSIAKIFMTDDQGIVAYQYVNGEWWTKVK